MRPAGGSPNRLPRKARHRNDISPPNVSAAPDAGHFFSLNKPILLFYTAIERLAASISLSWFNDGRRKCIRNNEIKYLQGKWKLVYKYERFVFSLPVATIDGDGTPRWSWHGSLRLIMCARCRDMNAPARQLCRREGIPSKLLNSSARAWWISGGTRHFRYRNADYLIGVNREPYCGYRWY